MMEEEYPRIGPTGRVTLLFTDIQSSTSLWEANEECMSECIILHDYILRSNLKDHHGFEVKTEGDAFMCAFPSCVDATKYCIAVQRSLVDAKWPKEIYNNYAARVQDDGQGHIVWKGLRVRMGLHSGQPSSKENPVTTRTDYFGKDVNYAARVSAAGCGGQILISASSMEDLFPYCSDAFEFDKEAPFGMPEMQPIEFGDLECWVQYIGQHGLKGISEAEHLFQVTPFGLEARQFLNPKLEEPSIPSRPRTNSRGSVRSQTAILVTEATAPPAPRSFESLQMEEVELDSRLFSHVVDSPHTFPEGAGTLRRVTDPSTPLFPTAPGLFPLRSLCESPVQLSQSSHTVPILRWPPPSLSTTSPVWRSRHFSLYSVTAFLMSEGAPLYSFYPTVRRPMTTPPHARSHLTPHTSHWHTHTSNLSSTTLCFKSITDTKRPLGPSSPAPPVL
eukprot:TRINITY_DN4087_c0_g1_i1.p1 TRINITY_DN4087_c0_g1~~TRINITY_DN4087_c0_g1_i1.p1  ORF type:complete len:446 (-),score=66.87 TRINITY_DN4087_c0_g1_i1:153-1490(-)